MPTVTLSSKNQITIPAELVRVLRMKAGAKLAVELVDDHLVVMPEPDSWAEYFRGSMKGIYGKTLQEIDRYVAEERASPERDEWMRKFYDMYAADRDVRLVVDLLRKSPQNAAKLSELHNEVSGKKGRDAKNIDLGLEKLRSHGFVREIRVDGETRYRLVREFAGS